jgi:DNA-binding CsgD family transcriptional regulator
VRSRERLRRALGTFDDLGAAAWAELARAELAATGETARRRHPSTLDELTPQEVKVSLLLAEGRTTREAAAALFLSPKTVEYHLRNAYRKLGIRSRAELAAAFGTRS